jgi:hypothetical protein
METLGYSSVVDLRLIVNGETVDVGQTGPDRIMLRQPRELPAGPAELVITVDGKKTTYPIVLQATNGPATVVSYW